MNEFQFIMFCIIVSFGWCHLKAACVMNAIDFQVLAVAKALN